MQFANLSYSPLVHGVRFYLPHTEPPTYGGLTRGAKHFAGEQCITSAYAHHIYCGAGPWS